MRNGDGVKTTCSARLDGQVASFNRMLIFKTASTKMRTVEIKDPSVLSCGRMD